MGSVVLKDWLSNLTSHYNRDDDSKHDNSNHHFTATSPLHLPRQSVLVHINAYRTVENTCWANQHVQASLVGITIHLAEQTEWFNALEKQHIKMA